MSSQLALVKLINANWGKEYHNEDHTSEWDIYFENEYHIKLEQADLTNDFTWVKQHIDKCEYYFINHVNMTYPVFQWENWRVWYHKFLCGDFD